MSGTRRLLLAALLLLVALYTVWFASRGEWVAVAVFALPPALLAARLPRGGAHVAFWAGVLALAWFSHGVMVAWTRAAERGFALAEIVLALAVVATASLPGLRARFGRRRGADL